MYRADLHLHTTISDGSEDAVQILEMAKQAGLTHLAFTNHDTTKMWEKYIAEAKEYGIHAIPGIEMSACDYEEDVKAHILGYGYTSTVHMEKIGSETLRKRNENGLKYIEILNTIGYKADTIFGEVYYKVFKNGGPCAFDLEYPDPVECVKAICADGGTAVLAHPGQQDNFRLLPKLVEAGLKGIEYSHPSHNEVLRKRTMQAAEEFGLFMTGGSDYHGVYEKTKTEFGKYTAHISSRAPLTKPLK